MAVPKSKVSKQRRNKRRSSVWKLETPGINTCPKCGTVTLPFFVAFSPKNFPFSPIFFAGTLVYYIYCIIG